MSILCWEKPKKVRSTEKHNSYYASDSDVAGTYVSNMSRKDIAKWKAKIVAGTTDHPQIEIRKNSFVVVVGLNGYNYKHYKIDNKHGYSTKGKNIHIASAGATILTFDEWKEFVNVIDEATLILRWLDTLKTVEEKKTYINIFMS